MFLYLPIEREINSPGSAPYQSFGLRVLRSEPEGEQEVMILPNVSTDFEFTLRLASLLTRKQLSPLRLLEVLEYLL